MSGGDGLAIYESSGASWGPGNAPLIAELAFFVAEITHPLLNLALSKQKLLSARFTGLGAAAQPNLGRAPSYRSTKRM
jgi:hypothetical protein